MRTVQARYFYAGRERPIRLIVLHSMESPEKGSTAESCAAWFANPKTRKASAHVCVDSDSEVRCVDDGDTAWAAKGANADGLHIEHAGYARQTMAEWTDPYGRAMLARSARITAEWCRKYKIPTRRLTPQQVRDGQSGVCDHATVTAAYPPGTGHTDPGPGFPWAFYMDLVRPAPDTITPPPAPPEEFVMASKAEVEQLLDEAVLSITGGVRVPGVDPDKKHVSNADVLNAVKALAENVDTRLRALEARP